MSWLTLSIFILFLCGCFGVGCAIPFVLLLFKVEKTISARISLALALIGGAATMVVSILYWQHQLVHQLPEMVSIPLFSIAKGLLNFSISFAIDYVQLFFLMLTGLFTIIVAVYSMEWLKHVKECHRVAGVFNLFILFTLLTVLADNVYFFLLFLEGMTLAFSYMALYKHNINLDHDVSGVELEESKTAFKAYLIFSHIGGVLITAAFLLLAVSHHFSGALEFKILQMNRRLVPDGLANIIFILSLAGFGIKAGVFPGHVWVPMVHPYSPTSIHAMMSGVILKVAGIYGMLRMFFQFLYPTQDWWGWVVVILAGITALVGVLYALVGRNLKTALASHSVENIGIILAGIGMALAFSSAANQPLENGTWYNLLAGIALIASLYHLLNHSIFKGLLFFCTGAIEERTGVVAFDKLGGLIRYYPWTAAAFLIGTMSISGFPPFNGFISEWLTIQAVFAGRDLITPTNWPLTLLCTLLPLLMLGSVFALTALAFMKIAGETLLGLPAHQDIMQNAKPGDVPWLMRGVLIFLSLACLLLGLFPATVINVLSAVIKGLNFPPNPLGEGGIAIGFTGIALRTGNSYVTGIDSTFLMFTLLIFVISFLFIIFRRPPEREKKKVSGPAWNCGEQLDPSTMQFTGSALTSLIWQPLSPKIAPILGKDRTRNVGLLNSRQYLTERRFIYEYFRRFYEKIITWVLHISQTFGDWFQNGDIRRYILYIFVVLLLVMIALIFLPGGKT